jgi:hypothetical protein
MLDDGSPRLPMPESTANYGATGTASVGGVSGSPLESFGCQSLLGIHWRRRTLDATAGGEALRNRMLCT